MNRTSFKNLTAGFSPERRDGVDVLKRELRSEMTLAELRSARRLTQEALAETLEVGQSAVAKLEKRTDMYVSNLRRFIEATGGTLEIRARFPDGEVNITNFAEIDEGADGATDDQAPQPVIGSLVRAMLNGRTPT
ncbi:MAG: transcriptional regulator [Sphingomonas sp.]|nr:MAG: transcriptional regulator [Sphingomonas sp.]